MHIQKLVVKNENFHWKKFDMFLIFAQNIDCGFTLESPRQGGSNEYPQSIFWSKNKKDRYTPAYPSFFYIKVGFRGVYFTWTCFRDGIDPNVRTTEEPYVRVCLSIQRNCSYYRSSRIQLVKRNTACIRVYHVPS